MATESVIKALTPEQHREFKEMLLHLPDDEQRILLRLGIAMRAGIVSCEEVGRVCAEGGDAVSKFIDHRLPKLVPEYTV